MSINIFRNSLKFSNSLLFNSNKHLINYNNKFNNILINDNNNNNNNFKRNLAHISHQLRKQHLMAEKERNFKFAGIQMLVGENKEENVKNALKFIDEAASSGANLVSLPECFNCPYATKVFEQYSETEEGETVKKLSEAAKKNNIWLIGGSIPEMDQSDGKIYNTCFIFDNQGNLIKKHRKIHLFDIDVPNKIKFKESETLSPGNSFTVIDIGFCKIGVAICYDIRFAELSMLYAREGAKMLVFPGSFNLVTGPAHWELLQKARAVDNQSYVAAVSPARNPDSTYQSWGHSSVIDPWGRVIAKTDEHQSIIYADINLNELNEVRSSIPITVQRRNDLYKLEKLV